MKPTEESIVTETAAGPANPPQHYALIPIGMITNSPLNPREYFDPEKLEELAASIREQGIIEPIVVRAIQDNGEHHVIIAGERRWRAATLAGLTEIPAIIRHGVDDREHLELALIENLHRADIDPIEEANGYRQLGEMGYSTKQIAEKVNRSAPAISNSIRLLSLPEAVRNKITAGELNVSQAKAMVRFSETPEFCQAIAELVIEESIPSKVLEKGLPDVWELREKGALVVLNTWQTKTVFDYEKVCPSCPFNAYLEEGSQKLCLKPAHYEELNATAREEQVKKAEQKKKRDEKKGVLPKYDWQQHVELTHKKPAELKAIGCSAECACRGQALVNDKPAVVCLDKRQHDKLEMQHTKRENKRLRKELAEELERTIARLTAEPELSSRLVLALLRDSFDTRIPVKDVATILGDLGVTIPVDELKASGRNELKISRLESVDPAVLLRAAMVIRVREEYRDAERNPQFYEEHGMKRTRYYMAPPAVEAISTADGKPVRNCRVCGCHDCHGCWGHCYNVDTKNSLCSKCQAVLKFKKLPAGWELKREDSSITNLQWYCVNGDRQTGKYSKPETAVGAIPKDTPMHGGSIPESGESIPEPATEVAESVESIPESIPETSADFTFGPCEYCGITEVEAFLKDIVWVIPGQLPGTDVCQVCSSHVVVDGPDGPELRQVPDGHALRRDRATSTWYIVKGDQRVTPYLQTPEAVLAELPEWVLPKTDIPVVDGDSNPDEPPTCRICGCMAAAPCAGGCERNELRGRDGAMGVICSKCVTALTPELRLPPDWNLVRDDYAQAGRQWYAEVRASGQVPHQMTDGYISALEAANAAIVAAGGEPPAEEIPPTKKGRPRKQKSVTVEVTEE